MRILIGDSGMLSRTRLEGMVRKWGHEVVSASDGQRAWQLLTGPEPPHAAVLDSAVSGKSGLQVCEEMRVAERERSPYILLLVGPDPKEDVLRAAEENADDYLVKPFEPNELRLRLRAAQRVVDLQSQVAEAQEALRAGTIRDSLTGLLNRMAVCDCLGRELERAGRENSPLGVAVANLDYFKCLNDTCGRLVGDRVLREVGTRLASGVRPYDVVGRYAGDEFIVVLPRLEEAAAAGVAERIRSCVAAPPSIITNGKAKVTVSVGMVVCANPSAKVAEALLTAAEAASQRAKVGGRNCVRLATLTEEEESAA